MKTIHVSAKVDSRLAALNKAGKSGSVLAQKVSGIIADLSSGAVRLHRDALTGYTKYGENRIRNCRKYDLGCGYRMIILLRGATLFIPFLGTHDETQRWLENFSRLKDFNAGRGRTIPVARRASAPADAAADVECGGDLETGGPLTKLTEKQMRQAFRGLIDTVGRKPSS